MDPPRINPPELFKRVHKRVASLSPTRSPTRQRITEDILSDLSPTTTLEAFTNPSGKLRASVEAATPSERAFGIRATTASKKIQEWVDELSAWPWPAGEGSVGFEVPAAKRRRISIDERTPRPGHKGAAPAEEEYIGSLPAEDVARYENRVDDIHEDMEDLDVEEIKSTVLNTHFSPKSRPSSSGSNAPVPSLFSSFTRMDDFTAVVTATVLQALPNLSKLMRLMDVWTVRLLVLRKVPPLLHALDDAEVALKSGWQAIEVPGRNHNSTNGQGEGDALERNTFEIMRDVLQDKVTTLGQDLDYMLDTLEGRLDTLPDIWLDRMETIERDYGEWVVRGDRKVREGEWARMAKARQAEADRIRAEAEAREAVRLQAEKEQREMEEKLRREQEEAARLERERLEAEERLRLEQLAAVEAARQVELARKREEDRVKAEAEIARLEFERKAALESLRLEQEAAESARQAEVARKQEEDRIKAEESARLETQRQERDQLRLEQEAAAEATRQAVLRKQEDDRIRAEEEAAQLERAEKLRLERVAAAESARLAALELARKEQEDRVRVEEEAARQTAERLQLEREKYLQQEKEAVAAEYARQVELAQKQEEADALRLKERQAADAEIARIREEKASRARQADLALRDEAASKAAEVGRQQAVKEEETTKVAQEPTRYPSTQEVEPKMVSPLVLALGYGADAAVAAGLMRPKSGDAKGRDMQMESSHQVPQSHIGSQDNPQAMSRVPNLDEDEGTIGEPEPEEPSNIASLVPRSSVVKYAPFDGSDEPKKEDSEPLKAPNVNVHVQRLQDHQNSSIASSIPFPQKSPTSIHPVTPTTRIFSEKPSSPRTPSTPPSPLTPVALNSPSARPKDGNIYDEKRGPNSPSKISRFGHGVASILRRTSSPKESHNVRPHSSESQPRSPGPALPIVSPRTPTKAAVQDSVPSTPAQLLLRSNTPPLPLRSPARERFDNEWVVVEPTREHDAQSADSHVESTGSSDPDEKSSLKAHNRNLSLVSGYSTSDPTPEILEAEPAEYFRPMLSPIKTARSLANISQQASPSKSPLMLLSDGNMEEILPARDGVKSTLVDDTVVNAGDRADHLSNFQALRPSLVRRSSSEIGSDGAQESVQRSPEELALEDFPSPVLARKTSIARINIPIRRIDIPRRASTASDTSTVMNRQPGDIASSPLSPSSPISERGLPEVDEDSPLKGRLRSRLEEPADRSSSSSPPPIPTMSPRRSFHLPKSPEAASPEIPSTPSKAPVFDNIDLSQGSTFSSPKKSTDDQIQAQISSLLESIPARIRLTSEPDTNSFIPSETLRPIKTRRSITPSFRSHSSLSVRAPTPSFTLTPAYGKGTSRPRPQNGDPEIKLYHLSRSTGEAPIKLFVRLVGENGERVMVRVGGGWADLGEYLREYASHHGRRSAVDSDKVEVQDIRPRVVSNASTASTATVRGNNGRSSPVSRPGSAFDRPMSSLHVRKTRRSIGETDSATMTFRNPSTPLPMTNRGRDFETPPSETSRSVSRLSWTEEEGGLGLAGPKAKKVAISERDQEWVESMKEKVRLASAEKEKKEKVKERKSFAEMDRIGGTKRLFRKG